MSHQRPVMESLDAKFDILSSTRSKAEDDRNQLMQKVVDLNEAKRIQSKLQSDLIAIDIELKEHKNSNERKRRMLVNLMLERDQLELMKENLVNLLDRNNIHIQDIKNELDRFEKQ